MAAKNNSIIDTKDLRKAITIFADNWLIVLVFLILSIGCAYFYSIKLPKIYASKTQVLLKTNETYSYQEGLFKGLGLGNSYERIANEQRILKSTDLISQTVSKLKLDVSYFIVGRIQTKEVFSGTPFIVDARIYSGNFYEFPFTIKIKGIDKFELSYTENGKQIMI